MKRRTLRSIAEMAILVAVFGCALSSPVGAQVQYQYQILHSFVYNSLNDGDSPEGRLVFDAKGNLYGATYGGGANSSGTVYELSPGTDGQWVETILYNFFSFQGDGDHPVGIVIDDAGNLYGMTNSGGTNEYGTAFELSPGGNGQWTESILWNFCSLPDCADGRAPVYPPTLGPEGALYGTAGQTAFQLSPGMPWTLAILYTFCSLPNCADGTYPVGSLVLGARGNLYGETENGGIGCNYPGCGVVFTLRPQFNGQWREAVLHYFGTTEEGIGAGEGVTLHNHALYGATQDGGEFGCHSFGCGTVFDLTRDDAISIGTREQQLHDFGRNEVQGGNPIAAVEFDARGDMFGVTVEGGSPSCECGIVYGMKPKSDGKWEFGVLHTFVGTDGSTPDAALALDSKGNLYGTTSAGGSGEGGVVFELSPTTQASK